MSVAVAIDERPRRRVGRPSKTATFRALTAEMLTREPALSSQAVLKAALGGGFQGAQSAFYAMVADVRRVLGVKAPRERVAELVAQAAEKRTVDARRRVQRRQERVEWEAKEGERIAQWTRERVEAKEQKEREREDRRTNWQRLQFHPTAHDEESSKLRVIVRRWLAGREKTHKSTCYARGHWRNHLAAAFGDLEPGEVDAARLRAFIEEKLATHTLKPGSLGGSVGLLAALFSDLVDEGVVERNPVHLLPKRVKRLYKSTQDPRATPFIERMEEVGRLRSALADPLRTMFSVAVMSGIRPGELCALRWEDFRSDLRQMHVQRRYLNGKFDTPKSGKSRMLSLAPSLTEVLREWRRLHPEPGLLFKPTGGGKCLCVAHFQEAWRRGLERAGLPRLTWYQATRHTFASQWVIAGQPIERLSKLLGHSSVVITEVYAHLKPENLNVPDVISFGAQSPYISTAEGWAA
jgi:integrase